VGKAMAIIKAKDKTVKILFMMSVFEIFCKDKDLLVCYIV